uniref:Double jelly roll-like domain-containing protein n=1 Tax=Cacopsylla melanoneura TaxID=428564 RepID=A0A8D9BGS8_9HEMI
MTNKENIYKKYDDAIISKHRHKFALTDSHNLNSTNNSFSFSINCEDDFLNMKEAKYYIKGSLVKKSDGSAYAAGLAIKLVDNFPAHLFKTIDVYKDETLIERVENLGRASTISGVVTSGTLKNDILSGFQSECKAGKFVVSGYLSDLGLGFFKHEECPIYKGNMKIAFIRNSDDDAIHRTGTDLPEEGKIVLDTFNLTIPVVKYEPTSKVELMRELMDLSKKGQYKFGFWSMKCTYQNVPRETNFEHCFNNVRIPTYVYVAFQSDRYEKSTKDSSNFDNCKVENISITCGDEQYPKFRQNGNFKEGDFVEFYDMFNSYRKVFKQQPLTPYTPAEFNEKKPVFVFDLSRHPKSMGTFTTNIVLNVDFKENVPENTRCYICFETSKEFVYDIRLNTLNEVL